MENKFLTEDHYAIAAKNGISRAVVYQRVNYKKHSIEEAITKPIFGWEWKKYKNIALENGISRDAFRARLNKGVPPEKAATIPLRQCRKGTKITKQIREIAKSNGIGKATLEHRVYAQKWVPMNAATEPLRKGGRKSERWEEV